MSEFKFSCPGCNQHIKIGAEFESRRIDCPSCQTKIIVPAPPAEAGTVPAATLAQPAARPKAAAPPPAAAAPVPPPAAPAIQPPKPAAASPKADSPFVPPAAEPDRSAVSSGPVTTVPPINDKHVAVLTPKLKLEVVRAIRPRLADQSRWLPGKKEAGQYNYAARQEGDKLVTVAPTDASATHFSLFGAVLLEFHRHNVLQVATGRREFLDEELTDAIRHVLGRDQDATPMSEEDREALTHEQSLAVLDVLEERYQIQAAKAEKRKLERKIDHVRLVDLVRKMEKSQPVRAEEVAAALYYELEELNQRIDALEQPEKTPE